MYPNLYYVFKDWFGIEVEGLKILNSFGLMVAVAFVVAAYTLKLELKRKEKLGLLHPREEVMMVGKKASFFELFIHGAMGFLFGYKMIGLFLRPADINPQEYIFSSKGSLMGGILMGLLLIAIRIYERNKQKLDKPEKRNLRIWPHDRVTDIGVIAMIFGILGAKIFDGIEYWSWADFVKDPVGHLFSGAGLTFYGGLILAAVAVCWYAHRKGIKIRHLVDAAAPGLILAYAIGRIGCQIAGDGDWGIYNSAYINDADGNIVAAAPGEFEQHIQKNTSYFKEGRATDTSGRMVSVTDRRYSSLEEVPRKYAKGISFLPQWLAAYNYPQNVNNDGILLPGNTEEYNRVLPSPVFPTPLYETILCSILFLLLWAVRKKIKLPLVMFGIYLILNGIERFLIESIRVNKLYDMFGLMLSQAKIIALCLILAGAVIIILAYFNKNKLLEQTSGQV
ncbi:MAG: prolipoprotein diacylglyceryl transferase family protein [Ferruginibacter sp.]